MYGSTFYQLFSADKHISGLMVAVIFLHDIEDVCINSEIFALTVVYSEARPIYLKRRAAYW